MQREHAQRVAAAARTIRSSRGRTPIPAAVRPDDRRAVGAASQLLSLQRILGNRTVSALLQRQLPAADPRTGNGAQRLPDSLRAGVESLSGLWLGDVDVHYNSLLPATLNALAYTRGRSIHLAPGQERHLAHEAWHVVQQAQGRVMPTTQTKSGALVNNEAKLEREADVMGERALAVGGANAAATPDGRTDRAELRGDGPVQRP